MLVFEPFWPSEVHTQKSLQFRKNRLADRGPEPGRPPTFPHNQRAELCRRGGCEGSKVGLTFSPHLPTSFSTPAAPLGQFGYHQPPQWLGEVGGAISGAPWPSPVGACHGWARSRFQIRKKIRSRSLIPVRPRWGPSGGGRHRRRHHATGSSTGFISRVSPSRLMTEEPLPTPAEPSVVAHDTKISKGRDSIVRIVRRPPELSHQRPSPWRGCRPSPPPAIDPTPPPPGRGPEEVRWNLRCCSR